LRPHKGPKFRGAKNPKTPLYRGTPKRGGKFFKEGGEKHPLLGGFEEKFCGPTLGGGARGKHKGYVA